MDFFGLAVSDPKLLEVMAKFDGYRRLLIWIVRRIITMDWWQKDGNTAV
jgi:hypothetical protein